MTQRVDPERTVFMKPPATKFCAISNTGYFTKRFYGYICIKGWIDSKILNREGIVFMKKSYLLITLYSVLLWQNIREIGPDI